MTDGYGLNLPEECANEVGEIVVCSATFVPASARVTAFAKNVIAAAAMKAARDLYPKGRWHRALPYTGLPYFRNAIAACLYFEIVYVARLPVTSLHTWSSQ